MITKINNINTDYKPSFKSVKQKYILLPSEAYRKVNSLRDMFKDVLQEMLEQELSSQLGYEKGDSLNKNTSNRRNGHSKKTG